MGSAARRMAPAACWASWADCLTMFSYSGRDNNLARWRLEPKWLEPKWLGCVCSEIQWPPKFWSEPSCTRFRPTTKHGSHSFSPRCSIELAFALALPTFGCLRSWQRILRESTIGTCGGPLQNLGGSEKMNVKTLFALQRPFLSLSGFGLRSAVRTSSAFWASWG